MKVRMTASHLKQAEDNGTTSLKFERIKIKPPIQNTVLSKKKNLSEMRVKLKCFQIKLSKFVNRLILQEVLKDVLQAERK